MDDDVKDFVDGELAAIQGQLKSLDEEFFQVRKHRDGLMNHARYLMAEKKQSRSTATRKNGKVQAENGSSHQLGVGNENVEESEDEVRKQSRAEMGRELMEHAKQIQQAARAKAEEERSKREQERRKAEEEKRRQEEIKRKKAEEEKRRQAEIERQNAEKERKRQELELELELELQQIKEKRNRVYAEETKQKQESELRRRQLEELRRQEEEEQRKAEELQRVRQAELEKEEEIRKKLARMRSGGEEAVKDESFMREARGKSVDLAALRPYKSSQVPRR